MKIVIIAPSHLPARRANTVQVMKMTQALATRGHSVRLLAPVSEAGFTPPAWPEIAHHYGLQGQFPIDWLPSRPSMRRYDFSLRAISKAAGWKADLVYTRLPQAAAAASQAGMPTLLEVHDLPQGALGPFMFRLFLRGRGARRLVAITHSLAADLVDQLRAPEPSQPEDQAFTLVAPDGVDLERYQGLPSCPEARRILNEKTRASLSLTPGQFVAGYTGHLYPGRGADLLFELAQRLPEMIFLLVGGEPGTVEQLRTRARTAGLENLVLTGFVANSELPIYQAACDVLLMPYQRQVAASSGGDIGRYLSPMKLFEYLASGRAILSSDLPVLREILSTETACLLPPEDAPRWVEALRQMQAQPELRAQMSAAAHKQVEQFTWEKRAARVLAGMER